jgi:hypothetical protein
MSDFLWRFFATLSIKLGFVKEAKVPIELVAETMNESLPTSFSITIPRGQGIITVLDAEVFPSKSQDMLGISLWSSFDIDLMGQRVYQAHVSIELASQLQYLSEEKSIVFAPLEVVNVRLISDEYSLIKSSQSILQSFTPDLVKTVSSLVNMTMSNAMNSMSGGLFQQLKNYASVYENGSKQAVLDYHLPEVKRAILAYTQSTDFKYMLDLSIREEALFAKLGKSVEVESDILIFRFNSFFS